MTQKIAFNPLPWYLHEDGWHPERAPALYHILTAVKVAGYDYVHADIPSNSSPREYLDLLDTHGLAPAPGYFSAACADARNLSENLEAARKAAAGHAALGLDRIFVAEQFGDAPSRFKTPAQAIDHDPARLNAIVDGLGKLCEAMKAEGVTACLHQHVSTWIESEDELETVLKGISPDILLLGPDTGHLTWVGADAAALIDRHRNRIGALHIKDMRKSVAASVAADGADYRTAGSRHIWTEPGRGDIDLGAVLDALRDYDGWYVIEVDIKDQPTVEESAALACQWLTRELAART